MVHGISAPGLSARPYFHRYSEDAIDLCDTPSAGASLESGRGSMAGGVTSARARSRRLLRDRCVGTYQVWLRYGLCALFTWKRGPGPRPPIHNKERVLPVSSPDKPRAPRNGSRVHSYRLVLPSCAGMPAHTMLFRLVDACFAPHALRRSVSDCRRQHTGGCPSPSTGL